MCTDVFSFTQNNINKKLPNLQFQKITKLQDKMGNDHSKKYLEEKEKVENLQNRENKRLREEEQKAKVYKYQ